MVAPVKTITDTMLQPILEIKANSIAIMPYAFCSPEKPEIRFNHKGQWWGESDEGVIGCIKMAHQKGLTVMLKPHLWIGRGIYTGAFTLNTEQDWKLWEESYREYVLNFAAIADSLKAEIFCIGTELGTTIKERPAYWSSLIDTLRSRFHGKLTYAGNWDDYKNFPFWHKLDYIGVDAYFPLVKDKTPSINSGKKAWNKWAEALAKISSKNGRPVLFTEYGYRNVDYTAAEPWKENEGAENNEGQAHAYEALFRSLHDKQWFAGGFLWKWYVDTGRHHRRAIDFTPQGKAAEKVIKKWYAQ
jgi:hypothetical protein